MDEVGHGWYAGEDYMNPAEVATPSHRVGKPNLDGSIGGTRITPCHLPDQTGPTPISKGVRVAYPRTKKDVEGKYTTITEQEHLARKHQQDTQ